jgi:hypothetical protein
MESTARLHKQDRHRQTARAAGYTVPDEPLRGTLAVAQWCAAAGIPADVVGRWVWVRFDERPSDATRAALCATGFRWVQTRGEWAHDCGFPSLRGAGRPRDKYGEVPVGAFAESEGGAL